MIEYFFNNQNYIFEVDPSLFSPKRIDKGILVSRIKNAVQTYKQYLVGKTFMFVYGTRKIEVIFKVESFMHMTGVASTLFSEDFYKKAEKRKLKQSEIMFDSEHPVDFANIKT